MECTFFITTLNNEKVEVIDIFTFDSNKKKPAMAYKELEEKYPPEKYHVYLTTQWW